MSNERTRSLQTNNNKMDYGSNLDKNDPESDPTKQRLKYPKSVFFIIGNEFCERFSYYGMRTILSLYLQSKLNFTETDSTLIYHTFVMLCYFFPLFGAILADSFIGKFKTILYLSIIYAIGSILLSVASTGFGFFGHSEKIFASLGLLLVALGTGGIKPCVSSFGGDQFVLPEQEKQLEQFFSVFYFSINAGSLISTFLTPELRSRKCLDQETCYPLAFGIPAVLMVCSLLLFIGGRSLYKVKKPSGNVMVDITKCTSYALKRKIKSSEKHDHWLDYAHPKYDRKMINDVKIVFSLILLFSPTILFWSLYEQQGTSWTFQATRMNGKIGSYTIKPDQMQVLNPILILTFIPLFECLVYPVLAKLRLVRTPLQKLTVGGFLVAVSFLVAALVENKIQPTYQVMPGNGEAQLRIINGINCNMKVSLEDNKYTGNVEGLGILQQLSLQANGVKNIDATFTINSNDCPLIKSDVNFKDKITISERESVSYLFSNDYKNPTEFNLLRLEKNDVIKKSEFGDPKLRIVYMVQQNSTLVLVPNSDSNSFSYQLLENNHVTKTTNISPDSFKLKFNDKVIADNIEFGFAGVYTMLIKQAGEKVEYNLYTITSPNTVHILWQVPQIMIISAAEIMFSITGLEFSYSQAPKSTKSVMSSLWLLTDAVGNLLTVIISETFQSYSQLKQYLIFASLMVIVMIVFMLLAMRYKYRDRDEDSDNEEEYNNVRQVNKEIESKDNPVYNSEE